MDWLLGYLVAMASAAVLRTRAGDPQAGTRLQPSDYSEQSNGSRWLLQADGDLAAARALFERALAIREHALGPDHPDTATSLRFLAHVLRDQGDLAAARALYDR